MSGHVGNLSPMQEEALKQLKAATQDVYKPSYDDYYYLRWLRAREFDVAKAENMMRKNIAFRKKLGADTILNGEYRASEIVYRCYPRAYLGPDKEGCPVRYMPFQNLDLKGLAYSVKKSDVLQFVTFLFEQDLKEMEEMGKKIGKVIEKHSYILDMEGYTFHQASNRESINMLNEILKLYEAHYPERMKTAYFINCPTYFNIILNFSKPFLSENTIKKFRIYGKDFQKHLLNDIDAEILPKFLGGERTDPDGNPKCESFIHFGSMIPPEHYALKNSTKSLEEEDGVTCIKIPRMSFRLVNIPVSEVNSIVEWVLESPSHDIGMGLYFRKNGEEQLKEIFPPERVSCHLVRETGTFSCEIPGTYVMKFDNTYSWLSSKKIFYKITVTRPDVNENCES